jgi:hypothetical protein
MKQQPIAINIFMHTDWKTSLPSLYETFQLVWEYMNFVSFQILLTELGRKQTKLTGRRLQELGLPYARLVRSTMRRANEIAQIILTSLPNIPVSDCCLLEEGAPILQEPPVGSWKPEPHVRLTLVHAIWFFFLFNIGKCMKLGVIYRVPGSISRATRFSEK